MILLTKRVEFCAAHRLLIDEKSVEENKRLFGKCYQPPGHGHNYVLEVTIGGEINKETGMVFDLKILKDIIKREIVDKLDHSNLNDRGSLLQGLNPTTENLAVVIWNRLAPHLSPARLMEVKLWETENNLVTYRGEP